ncbi:M43 family zinc metalloprotease [Culturomica massiliensis]|jgi:PKD repeat protein|uniref:M43 family zinc metalloprotease n=1 Tax=Culturomica massiliensis TaxID=1841857 RepID=UPI000E55C228|nr:MULTISPECIES: M43 family zinc metalloprotease [Odoribacteraceae]RHV94226.1 PKD domain-containing protein [Odoribacter sp. OF09-27XD]
MKSWIKLTIVVITVLLCACHDDEVRNKVQVVEEPLSDIGCRTAEMNREMAMSIPEGYQGRGSLLTKAYMQTRASSQKYIIPVVFHVYGTSFLGKSVTVELIEDALKRTNEDFQGLNGDWQRITAPFDLIKKELNIEFRLAQKDPEGKSTTGVIFYPKNSGFGGLNKNPEIAACAWDNYSYMNVYVMEDLYGDQVLNNSGVAWYPDEWMSDRNLARVVYNGAYIGKNTTENFRRVLTHEFGHWLGLAHTFEGGCTYPNDEVDDTPPHEKNMLHEYDLNCEGNKTNWQNFMTYTDMYANFTTGQVERMLAMLEHPARFPIWQEENLKKTLYLGDEAVIEVGEGMLFEDKKNDGTFSGRFELNVKFASLKGQVNDELSADTYEVQHLPEGLSVRVVVAGASLLHVFVDGQAVNHSSADNTFFILRFTGDICDKPLHIDDQHLELRFRNPYQIVTTEVSDVVVCAGQQRHLFQLSSVYPSSKYSLVYEGGKLRIDTYSKALATESFSRNVSCLSGGDEIPGTLSWITGSDNFIHDLYTPSYNQWKGKMGYVGLYFPGADQTERLYGWLKLSVSTAGDSVILHSYAFREEPGIALKAGQKEVGQNLIDPEIYADKTVVNAGEQVRFGFSAWSNSGINTYRWSFPGGTPAASSEKNPEVSYEQSGIYDVSLEVTDRSGESWVLSKSRWIQVKEGGTSEKPEITSLIVLTGNGDKFFRIENPERYADSELTIWDPRRKEILKRQNYRNDFEMKGLAAGTYYYRFTWKAAGQKEEVTGFVELVR